MTDTQDGGMTAEETSYFETRGESGPAGPGADPGGDPGAGPEGGTEDGAAGPAGAPEPEEPKQVPLQALHEERNRRRDLQRRIEEERRQRALLEGRFEELARRLQPAGPPPPAAPDPDADPAGYLRHMDARIRAFEEQRAQADQQARRQAEQRQLAGRFASAVTEAERAFAAQTPDYQEAVDFLRQRRAADLSVMGYGPQEQAEILHREGVSIAAQALQRGLSPAEVAYRMAKGWGYRQADRQPAPATFESAQRGAATSVSLSGRGGAAPKGLTLEAVVSMSDAEFAGLSEADFRRLAGG